MFSRYGVVVAIDTVKGRGIDCFSSGQSNQGNRRWGVLETRKERMEGGLNAAKEEADIGYLRYFIQHRGI